MNTAPTKDGFQIEYKSDAFDKLVKELEENLPSGQSCLLLLAGKSKKQKNEALKEIKECTDRNLQTVDANEIISASETETQQKLDTLFENYSPDETLLYMVNGANLCGAFTSYTLSTVKYATPQERYFLKKLRKSNAFVVIDFHNYDDIDRTLKRAAHSMITIKVPDSGLQGLFWKLKSFHVNGYELNSKRPVGEGVIEGNF